MRRALVIGIDDYLGVPGLHGCVTAAESVARVLERNGDGSPNYDVRLLAGTGPDGRVSGRALKDGIRELFADGGDAALLYFAGHGYADASGGYLLASDSATGDDGVAIAEVLALAEASRTLNRMIVLDCCYAGMADGDPERDFRSTGNAGATILAGAARDQFTDEHNSDGGFTGLFVDALNGAAANLLGEITPISVYAHIDQSLGSWAQRPVFHVGSRRFHSMRRVAPAIGLADLRRITEFFPSPGWTFQLDPSFEPEGPCPDPVNTKIFSVLQKMNRVNLVVPVGAPHMYHAAMDSKACRLTVLGEHYRRLVALARI